MNLVSAVIKYNLLCSYRKIIQEWKGNKKTVNMNNELETNQNDLLGDKIKNDAGNIFYDSCGPYLSFIYIYIYSFTPEGVEPHR